ncbi:sensor histidine kinase [Frateuria sp. GZRe12]|uniref:sensor histidine kinase n=1 Tax=Frateuria sp. GZRe12 TaxID=3351533 RepID=UPI003EDBC263
MRARIESDVLRNELAHRLKNTLASVQAIASRTFTHAEEKEAFHARLMALSAAHSVLQRQYWSATSIRTTAEALLAVYGRQIDLDGPEVQLGQKATVGLSLVLHELDTNAVKYGALSVPQGSVTLRWRIEADELLMFWCEAGGPIVALPIRKGFGSRLIDMGLLSTGKVERRYPPSGVQVQIRVPLWVAPPHLSGQAQAAVFG